jgi:2-polyprenyl-6-methoxyphenol hydroxylase-like FAD-dependent oxidoreductase
MSKHGVVIGGGIGGLLAAFALAPHCDRVTVLERDPYPTRGDRHDAKFTAPPPRKGAQQSRCLHLLTAAGANAFDELAPGWREDLVSRGAIPFDPSADALMRVSAGWLPRAASGILVYACSRALIEEVLRRRLAVWTNVRIEQGRRAVGLLSQRPGGGTTGVQLAAGDAAGKTTVAAAIEADLVVDASGAGSQLRRWLARLPAAGGSQPETTVIEPGMEYVSRWFYLAPEDAPDWMCLSVAPAGAARRGAMMLRAEQDRWGVVLVAPTGDRLPADDDEFLQFAAGIGDGLLRRALARALTASPIHRYRSTPNRMVHYDRLAAWPDGLAALGDSVCMLDPYFGLGMTAAARGASLLRAWVGRQEGEISVQGFQRELAALNAAPWRLATGRDPDGSIQPTDIGPFYAAAPANPAIARALVHVHHMLRPADSLVELIA